MKVSSIVGITLDKIEVLLKPHLSLSQYNKIEEYLFDLADDVAEVAVAGVSDRYEEGFEDGVEDGKEKGKEKAYADGVEDTKRELKRLLRGSLESLIDEI